MRHLLRLTSIVRFCLIAVAGVGAGLPAALGHGAMHERIEKLRASITAEPGNARLHLEIADVFVQHEDWFYAIAHLDKVEALAPREFDTRLLRGQALVGAGRMADARAVLDEFLKTSPEHPVALLARARALAEHDACLDDYRRALAATPNPEPDLIREVADALVKRNRTDEAVRVLQAGLAKLGDVPSLLTAAMQLELATGRTDDALARVEAMRQRAPRPEPWMAKRAELLAQAGRAADARTAWQALLDHLAALPNLDRGSPSMTALAAQAQEALRVLSQSPTNTAQRSNP